MLDIFQKDGDKFTAFFRRAIRLVVPPESDQLSLDIQRYVLTFLIHAFQSLENGLVRRECLK